MELGPFPTSHKTIKCQARMTQPRRETAGSHLHALIFVGYRWLSEGPLSERLNLGRSLPTPITDSLTRDIYGHSALRGGLRGEPSQDAFYFYVTPFGIPSTWQRVPQLLAHV